MGITGGFPDRSAVVASGLASFAYGNVNFEDAAVEG
jgi:hypothetical protein